MISLGPPYENPDKLLVSGGVYRRLVWYKSRPVGWIAYGVNRHPNQVNLWMQDHKGYTTEQDIVTYESEEAALMTAEIVIKQLLGEEEPCQE